MDPKTKGMVLPEGKTCVNCYHFKRCSKMFAATETRTDCDFYPSRFIDGEKWNG